MQLGKLMSYTYEEIQSHFISSFLFAEEKLCQYCGSDKFCVQKVHPSSDVHRGMSAHSAEWMKELFWRHSQQPGL